MSLVQEDELLSIGQMTDEPTLLRFEKRSGEHPLVQEVRC